MMADIAASEYLEYGKFVFGNLQFLKQSGLRQAASFWHHRGPVKGSRKTAHASWQYGIYSLKRTRN